MAAGILKTATKAARKPFKLPIELAFSLPFTHTRTAPTRWPKAKSKHDALELIERDPYQFG